MGGTPPPTVRRAETRRSSGSREAPPEPVGYMRVARGNSSRSLAGTGPFGFEPVASLEDASVMSQVHRRRRTDKLPIKPSAAGGRTSTCARDIIFTTPPRGRASDIPGVTRAGRGAASQPTTSQPCSSRTHTLVHELAAADAPTRTPVAVTCRVLRLAHQLPRRTTVNCSLSVVATPSVSASAVRGDP